jgi:hypothetical protein
MCRQQVEYWFKTLDISKRKTKEKKSVKRITNLRPLQSKSNPQYVNEGKRGLIFADKGCAKNQ